MPKRYIVSSSLKHGLITLGFYKRQTTFRMLVNRILSACLQYFVFAVLCSQRVCEFRGEVCALDKYNSPRCSCLSKCPTPRPEEKVCGSDGIPYKSVCELNRTACILGATDITIHNRGGCRPSKYIIVLIFMLGSEILYCIPLESVA